MTQKNIHLLIADDHVIIRRGLRFLLESMTPACQIDETDSQRGIINALTSKIYTHLILDMQMQDGNLLDIISNITGNYPQIQIMIYTMNSEDLYGLRMLKLGAHIFLNKQTHETDLKQALQAFLNNQPYVSSHLSDLINDNKKRKNKDAFASLSDRELTVLNNILAGKSLKEIAINLDLKANTVATFKARIFDKLGVSNLIDLKAVVETYQRTGK
ncbi:MAG: response regulator transcription factor [Bacteroidia bacterium]|nr:response regulator transcription factor [Bacteroidia bacterium]